MDALETPREPIPCGMLAAMIRERDTAAADEAGLIARARAGDREAFGQLVTAHLPMVWRVAFRVVRHPEDAEDVAQEVFLTAWKGLAGFRAESRFSTWLHQIAVTRAINHLDRSAERIRRHAVPIDPSGGDAGSAEIDAGPALEAERRLPSPLAALEAEELRRRLAWCLEKLPGAWRAVLALRDGEGLSYEDIARSVQTAVGTVRSRLARARTALRDCLSGEQP